MKTKWTSIKDYENSRAELRELQEKATNITQELNILRSKVSQLNIRKIIILAIEPMQHDSHVRLYEIHRWQNSEANKREKGSPWVIKD